MRFIDQFRVPYDRGDIPPAKTDAVPSWGRDGWDLGQWPYVVISHGETDDGKFAVKVYVEGDVDYYVTDSEAVRNEITDFLAWFYWNHSGEFPGPYDELPPERRGPFSWGRLEKERTQ